MSFKRPPSLLPHHHTPKRRRTSPSLPRLPPDIWHHIATNLSLVTLSSLSQTSRQNNQTCRRVLLTHLHHLFLPDHPIPHSNLPSLLAIVRLLDTAPSLRPKRCMRQLALLLDAPSLQPDLISCFTPEQAAAFLRVDPFLLRSRFAPARVAAPARTRSRKLRSLYSFAFQPHPPVPRGSRLHVYSMKTVLHAALQSHPDLDAALRFVNTAVNDDLARFRRAEAAEKAVEIVVQAKGLEVREVEWVLAASDLVVQFRRGGCEHGLDVCLDMVVKLVEVHHGLGPCYKCLLICDGNARLKARRIVEKVLKGGWFCIEEVVRVLEGKLWWARSKSNVEKMEMMFRQLPDIRV